MMRQQSDPHDYVIVTGETHTVRELLNVAFGHLNLEWQKFVKLDPRYFRPSEVDLIIGDASKAKTGLGWERKVSFKDLSTIGRRRSPDL
jgi:GDPmannose 4,6-dehydratase